MKKVTKEELGKATGADGEKALVAVDGKVYDVTGSGLWAGGRHMNAHSAGRDLSAEIKAAPHGMDVLDRFDEVGEVEPPAPSPAAPAPGPLVTMILARHPHPVSVHFPIALAIAGALFTVVGVAFSWKTVETAGFLNLALGTVMSPPAIGAGLLSWWYNYGHAWTPIFRRKILLSVLYLAVASAAVAAWLLAGCDCGCSAALPWRWIFVGLAVALPPVAMGLGFLGGKITFPS